MQVSVHAAKTNLSKLIEAVERGERVVITRHGAPAAELIPARKSRVRLGGLKGQVAPPPDGVFAPMDPEELRDWGAL
jgi:prevent-host-death family protein